MGNNLSERGFKNAVKRQMKTERSKMKAWFLSGKKECPVYIEPDQWARLCEYWSKPETEQKAMRMANARKASEEPVQRWAGWQSWERSVSWYVLCLEYVEMILQCSMYIMVELGLLCLKSGPLKQCVFLMTEEEETEESWDY